MKKFLKNKENLILSVLSFALAVNTILFVARRLTELFFLRITEKSDIFYFSYFVLFVLILGTLLFFAKKINMELVKKLFLVLLPTEIIFLYALEKSRLFNPALYFPVGCYLILAGAYFIKKYSFRWKEKENEEKTTLRKWFYLQGKLGIGIVLIVMIINLLFGSYHIAEFAAVDEPLWTFDRIPSFWSSLKKHNWYGSRVSDKPGLTVAVISGAGLLWENPDDYKDLSVEEKSSKNIENMNFALRFPLFLFVVLSLPFIYFFLERLLGKNTALFSLVFIGLSPILIGMARIINPDSILWVFTTLAFLSQLVYLKKRTRAYLYWSGIFLGFALLTKYVANILYIFFFLLIFTEYIFNKEKYSEMPIKKYIKESFVDYAFLIFISLATFYVLYPAVWVKFERLLIGTIYSQAFIAIWKPFLTTCLIILVDNLVSQSRIVGFILNFISRFKKALMFLFFASIIIFSFLVLANVYLGMNFLDFEEIIASPKSAYMEHGQGAIFLTNFYPFVFGIVPISFLAIIISLFCSLKNSNQKNKLALFYCVAFIIMYYLGSSVEHVVSIVRYQVMLFPLAFIIAGAGIECIASRFNIKEKARAAILLLLISACSFSLYRSYPFYMSYASSLLPNEYYLDIKDMGSGSFEAARFLNKLPDAEKLIVWSDKRGVCYFFKGLCLSNFDPLKLRDIKFDYVVISSGRAIRTHGMVKKLIKIDSSIEETKYFDKYYEQEENVVYELDINNRPDQFIKVFKTE